MNLREYKRELEELLDKRENTEIYDSDQEYTDLCDRIDGYYKDITEAVLYNEKILEKVQEMLDEEHQRNTIFDVSVKDEGTWVLGQGTHQLGTSKAETFKEWFLWTGYYDPKIGQKVEVDGGGIVEIIQITNEPIIEGKEYREAYEPLACVCVVSTEDDEELTCLWCDENEEPYEGGLFAIRLGYMNYIEAHVLEMDYITMEELEELREEKKLYKAYSYERMTLHKYGYDPDEDGKND